MTGPVQGADQLVSCTGSQPIRDTGMIRNVMLVNPHLHTKINFSENYRQFGYVTQKSFTNLGHKILYNIGFKRRQIIKLPGILTILRLALVTL